jgi:hypothetical protein
MEGRGIGVRKKLMVIHQLGDLLILDQLANANPSWRLSWSL